MSGEPLGRDLTQVEVVARRLRIPFDERVGDMFDFLVDAWIEAAKRANPK